MRRTALFCRTLRENPAETETAGQQLLVRGGYVLPLAAGIFSLLPLGQRVRTRVEAILRAEMERIGGQEVQMPVVNPAELWQESERWQTVGAELLRFADRAGRDLVLAMTHEEVLTDLLRRGIHSYRQLPVLLYQLQTKFRDEPRARGGLLRAREFVMKDAYSGHTHVDDLDRFYPTMLEAYSRIFATVDLPVLPVQADVGMMGGSDAHEFMYMSEIGEDQIAICDQCHYAANRQTATFVKDTPAAEQALPLEEVATPGTRTIADLAAFLNLPATRTAKAAFFIASPGDRLVFAVVRGDMEVNETKLAHALQATDLRPALSAEFAPAGIVAGYASPVGIRGALVVVDDLVAQSPNLVAGANKEGYHLLHTNAGRDYQPDLVADIVAAYPGAPCPRCHSPLRLARGVEVGNTFKLGTRYSAALGARFLDEQGQERNIVMGSYGIGVGRLIACLAEHHRDERGLIWPQAVAPFAVYLVGLDLQDSAVHSAAESLYGQLLEAGIEVLYDDRDERAGVKFNDADLLGIPLRITISRRTLQDTAVEFKARRDATAERVPLSGVLALVQTVLAPVTAPA
jgi:prolyl-tRNA synthetase